MSRMTSCIMAVMVLLSLASFANAQDCKRTGGDKKAGPDARRGHPGEGPGRYGRPPSRDDRMKKIKSHIDQMRKRREDQLRGDDRRGHRDRPSDRPPSRDDRMEKFKSFMEQMRKRREDQLRGNDRRGHRDRPSDRPPSRDDRMEKFRSFIEQMRKRIEDQPRRSDRRGFQGQGRHGRPYRN